MKGLIDTAEEVWNFKDYRDLPFSEKIQNQLFKKHWHLAELKNEGADDGNIYYSEKDVLIMLVSLHNEYVGQMILDDFKRIFKKDIKEK